jgi:hypothetical protein
MRPLALAALTALLAVPAVVCAQPCDCCPTVGGDAPVETSRFWGLADYLLWWFKNGRVPPLVTAGDRGVVGAPGTQVLLDDLDFDDGVRQGGRFVLGYQFETNPCLGIEVGYFFLPRRQSTAGFASSGDPPLAQPFFNISTNIPDATLVALSGVAVGSVAIETRTGLWGAEANLARRLVDSDRFHLTALGGFRLLRLDDELTSSELFQVAPSVPGFGGSTVRIQDQFRTINNFYGGQVGIETGGRYNRLTVDFCGKLALGSMQQDADVDGEFFRLRPDGSATFSRGGLYALPTNIGSYHRGQLAFIPEAGLDVGFELTSHVTLRAGYSFLWVSAVARAGEQIDPVVNVTQFRIRSPGPFEGPARPAFEFQGTDFWAQGVNIGLELRY